MAIEDLVFDLQEEIGHLATPNEAMQEFAWIDGAERPEQAWLLHDWDVWIANPHYHGPPVSHPEDYGPEDECEDPGEELSTTLERVYASLDDDIPF